MRPDLRPMWLCGWVLLLPGFLAAQTPSTFNLNLKAAGTIYAVAGYTTGSSSNRIMVGGDFTSINGVNRKYLAVVGLDGTVDPLVLPRPNGPVYALAANSNVVYVGGEFDFLDGNYRRGLAKLAMYAGGANVDATFNPMVDTETYQDSVVHALLLDGTNLYVGGDFQFDPRGSMIFDGQNITRLDAIKGPRNQLWGISVNGGPVYTMSRDGTALYLGGDFTSFHSTNESGWAHNQDRLLKIDVTDGRRDAAWQVEAGDTVHALDVYANFAYVGGLFTNITQGLINKYTREHLAKLSKTNGMPSADFQPNPDGPVYTLYNNGSVYYVGGDFTHIAGYARKRLAKITTGGDVHAWLPNADGPVRALHYAAISNAIVAGGYYGSLGGATRYSLALLHVTSGVVAAHFDVPIYAPAEVRCLAQQADGSVVVGGFFDQANGQLYRNLLRLTPAGALDSSWKPQANGMVESVACVGDEVVAGGWFTQAGGAERSYLAKIWTNGVANAFWRPNPDRAVYVVYADGQDIYVGGQFMSISYTSRNFAAKLDHALAIADPHWNPAPSHFVRSFLAKDDKIYMGGHFFRVAGSTNYPYLVRLTKTYADLDSVWNPRPKGGAVYALAAYSNDVVAGGIFTNIGGTTRRYLARLNNVNGGAQPWAPNPNSGVYGLAVQHAGLFVGGYFTNISSVARGRIAKVDLNSAVADSAWRPHADSSVNAVLAGNGWVMAGGSFTNIGGAGRAGLAAFGTFGGGSVALPWLLLLQ